MNFLAHTYLSGDNKDLIIGNFIADSVRGKEFDMYREGIKKGILLHRKIDSFTDKHPIVSETNDRLKIHLGKYAPVVSDIYYDHFLALYWNEYSKLPLLDYTKYIYKIINSEISIMPEEVKMFFPYMERNNWLFNYQTFYGMEKAFEGMSKRASFVSNMEKAVPILKEYYTQFEDEFRRFFPLLEDYVSQEKEAMLFEN